LPQNLSSSSCCCCCSCLMLSGLRWRLARARLPASTMTVMSTPSRKEVIVEAEAAEAEAEAAEVEGDRLRDATRRGRRLRLILALAPVYFSKWAVSSSSNCKMNSADCMACVGVWVFEEDCWELQTKKKNKKKRKTECRERKCTKETKMKMSQEGQRRFFEVG